MPDKAVAEADRPVRIEVLANDIGLPGPEQPSPILRIEAAPTCGKAEVEGRAIVYTGPASCIGTDVTFGYSVTIGDEPVTGLVSVAVKAQAEPPPVQAPVVVPERPNTLPPASASCEMPGLNWTAVPIRGASYAKADAPPAIVDLVELIDEPQFTVQPFCMTVEGAPADLVDPYFDNLSMQDRQNLFPELQNTGNVFNNRQDPTSRVSARVSQHMARAFGKWAAERSGRQLALPSLEEYVAAAWDLETRQPRSPDADVFLVTLRSGNLQWTRSPCGGSESFWLIGPSAQGRLVKLCYEQSRLDRTGFRLSVK